MLAVDRVYVVWSGVRRKRVAVENHHGFSRRDLKADAGGKGSASHRERGEGRYDKGVDVGERCRGGDDDDDEEEEEEEEEEGVDGRTDDAMMMMTTTRFRTEKTARLRAAVEEAKVEIAAYRAEREGRYARMVQEVRARLARRRAQYRLVVWRLTDCAVCCHVFFSSNLETKLRLRTG